MYDEIEESKYNRVFQVSKKMIQNHIDSIQYGSVNYIPDPNILFWPAKGNPTKGQPENLAPFEDGNGNGTYDPMDGEYPIIYGNDCLYTVMHYRNNGETSKAFAIRSWTYSVNCDTSDIFDNIIFRKIFIISHGAELDSLQFGAMVDGDIGFPEDDYKGTNVNLRMGYFYNSLPYDNGQGGQTGFSDTLPAVGVLFLRGFKQQDDGIDNEIGIESKQSVNGFGFNDGIIDN